MDKDGIAYAYEKGPAIKEGYWTEELQGEGEHISIAWYPPEVAKQNWRDSLREVQP